ncbi:MAG TPA: right-handed parallel beta-helix repeat-containing protein [Candidatus Angelobacter sp.]|jgi:hypothetical protein|nr:right-handed parallel beta-helix repeat-containing protein [Candidatus Angelobacter sp.]
MSKTNVFIVKAFSFLAVLMFATIVMHGQAARTFVSGGTNANDSNACSNAAPCRTFAAAIANTSAGGEIDALDTAEYGPVTITKAITIDGGGQVASIQADGVNGIVVSAGANDKVILRNLRINGSNTGLNGIRFLSGSQLTIDKCEIFGFTLNGVDISQGSSAQSWVTNTNIGMVGGVGIRATTTAGVVTLGIDKVRVEWSNKGIEAAFHSRVTVNDSLVQNAASIGMQADGDALIVINGSVIDLNGSGVQTSQVAGVDAVAYVANSEIAFNSTGFNELSGRINTFGNNRLIANGSDGVVRPPIAMK